MRRPIMSWRTRAARALNVTETHAVMRAFRKAVLLYMVRPVHHIVSEIRTRVAVYARFSCDKQRDASIEDQLYEAERYCETRNYEIVRAYTDYAISGRSDDRPQFLQMIEDAKAGAFDVVLVWKMDRFARNMQDQFFHEKILNDCGVLLESVKENIAGNGVEASMSKGMHAIFAQIRSQQSAEDTMRGMLGKARKCQYLGYQWLGYTHEGDEIVIDPGTAPIARRIHEDYLSGNSVKDIVEWINSQGVRNRNGDPVGYQFVTGILKNWAYAGVYTWGKQKDERGNVILDANGLPVPLVRVDDGIPAIVSTDVKERCLKRLCFHRHVKAKVDYVLSGKLVCSKCGQPMHGEVCRNKYGVECFRYVCRDKRRACTGVYWKDEIESAIASNIRAALTDPELVELIADAFSRYQDRKRPSASIEAVQADIKSLKRQRANLIKAVEDGMPYSHVKERLERIDAQQAGMERKIADLERSRTEITKSDVLQMLSMIVEGARTDAEILGAFVYQVRLYRETAVAVLNLTDRETTQYEIDCAIKKLETAGQQAVSSVVPLVPPIGNKTNPPSSQVILLENGLGFVVSLKAA